MKITISILFCFTLAAQTLGQETVSISDFAFLNDTAWEGNLMYVNYGDGKKVTIKTTMHIKIKGDNIILRTGFPDEPKANSVSNIKLKKGGSFFGSEEIIERIDQDDGTLKIVTRYQGSDNGRKAIMLKTYRINKVEFSITKEVKVLRSEETFIRNQSTYKRIL